MVPSKARKTGKNLAVNSREKTALKKSNFTDQQIALALKQAETGTPIEEVCRKLGRSQQTFYRWKKKFAGLGSEELRRLKQLEEENKRLKPLVADLSLDKQILQDVPSKKLGGLLAFVNVSKDPSHAIEFASVELAVWSD